MCDDMEESNFSISDHSGPSRQISTDSSKNMDTKTTPRFTENTPANKVDAIERVDLKEDGNEDKQLSTMLSSPEKTLLSNQLPKEVIVHSPE